MENFDWTHLHLAFPEFARTDSFADKEFWKNFPETPEFEIGVIKFALENIGVEMFLPIVPTWLNGNVVVNEKPLSEFYQEHSNEVYEQMREELTKCLPVFAKWKPNVHRYQEAKKDWEGELPDRLEFTNHPSNVSVWDYSLIQKGVKRFGLTDVVLRIGKIPEKVLDEKLRRYREFTEFVIRNERGCNSITGENLVACVRNMDRVYSELEELKGL